MSACDYHENIKQSLITNLQVIIQCSYQANPSSLRRVKWYHNGQVIDFHLKSFGFDINVKNNFDLLRAKLALFCDTHNI